MNKIWVIGRTEFLQTVRSKGFLIGIFLMPVLMGGSLFFQLLIKDQVDLEPRRAVVVDATGQLMEKLTAALTERNEKQIWSESAGSEGEPPQREQQQPVFEIEAYPATEVEPSGDPKQDRDAIRLALSKRVSSGELQGFFLIGKDVVSVESASPGGTPAGGAQSAAPGEAERETRLFDRSISYLTDEPTYGELRDWVYGVLNQEVKELRFEEEQLDKSIKQKVELLSASVPLGRYGLTEVEADGSISGGEAENKLRTFMVPLATLMMLFMLVMTSAPQLMNNVLEEKMQRISEVLVSAVTPFQLLLGKLLGGVMITLTLGATYLGGVAWASYHYGFSDLIPSDIYAWFAVMIIFALFMYGALFSALGAACNELRDAQSMMMPAMAIVLIPMFAFSVILENPNGSVAQVLTFVPTCTPMILLFRLATQPGPELWEILVGLLSCVLTTWALVWASAKIFQVGILSQGQPPSYRKLISWIRDVRSEG